MKKSEIEAHFVEFTARYLWPLFRFFVGSQLQPRCQKCILPNSYSKLNEKGICQLCSAEPKHQTAANLQGSEKLKADLDREIRESLSQTGAREFDALVLMSGGKDSAYMLKKLTLDYPELRLLSVIVDNGFLSPVAIENLKGILQKFPIPHWHIKLDPKAVSKVFQLAFENIQFQTGYSVVDLLDGLMTFSQARKSAAANRIPLIFCGLNPTQFESVFGPARIVFPSELEAQGVSKVSRLSFDDLQRATGSHLWFKTAPRPQEYEPKFILPFTVWNPSEIEILKAVSDWGLLKPNRSRPLLTNNALIPLIGMAEVAHFGYSCWEVEFAHMIRQGKSQRTYWLNMFQMLEYTTRTGHFLSSGIKSVVRELNLDLSKLKLEHLK